MTDPIPKRPGAPPLSPSDLSYVHFATLINPEFVPPFKLKWSRENQILRIIRALGGLHQAALYLHHNDCVEHDGLKPEDIVAIYRIALSELPKELKQMIDDPLYGEQPNLVHETDREKCLYVIASINRIILRWQPTTALLAEQTKIFEEYLETVDNPETSYPLGDKYYKHVTKFMELVQTYPSCEPLLSLRTQWTITRGRSLERLYTTRNEKVINWEESGTPPLMIPILAGEY